MVSKNKIALGIKYISRVRSYGKLVSRKRTANGTTLYMSTAETDNGTPKQDVYFAYLTDSKQIIKQLKMCDYQQFSSELSGHKLLILVADSITAPTLVMIKSQNTRVQILSVLDVVVPRIEHMDVPRYIKLAECDIKEYESQIGPRNNWPAILATRDPVARVLDMRSGECYKVVNTSPICGIFVSVRTVSEYRGE